MPRFTIESWPFTELIHLIEVDKRECIGNERLECAIATLGIIVGASQGMSLDMYDVLSMNPWSRTERPLPTDAELARQAGCVWDETRQQYVDAKMLKEPKQNG